MTSTQLGNHPWRKLWSVPGIKPTLVHHLLNEGLNLDHRKSLVLPWKLCKMFFTNLHQQINFHDKMKNAAATIYPAGIEKREKQTSPVPPLLFTRCFYVKLRRHNFYPRFWWIFAEFSAQTVQRHFELFHYDMMLGHQHTVGPFLLLGSLQRFLWQMRLA